MTWGNVEAVKKLLLRISQRQGIGELLAEGVKRASEQIGGEAVDLGVSPRGTLSLFKASQALAALRGRDYVIPSDVQDLCAPVLSHRLHISPQIRLRGRTPAEVVAEIVGSVPVPVVE